jgi:hypothetical protein
MRVLLSWGADRRRDVPVTASEHARVRIGGTNSQAAGTEGD